jgi:hypothetical protein
MEALEESKSSGNKYGLPRTIPEAIKREVRQRCGFGCVICGLGLYEYEHFEPEYTEAKNHDPAGITLLCPNHHAKKTKGTLSIETVKEANANPKAIQQRHAHEKFDLTSKEPVIVLGTAKFINTPKILVIDGEVLLAIEPGQDVDEPFLLSATLKDREGALTLSIVRNEWNTPTDSWDCKAEGNKIEIRSAPGIIELVLRQEPPKTIVIERLTMFHKGHKIVAQEGKRTAILTPTGVILEADSCIISDCQVGLTLRRNSIGLGFGGGSVNLTGFGGPVAPL